MLTTVVSAPEEGPREPLARRSPARLVVMGVALAAYILGLVVLLRHDWLFGDTISRVANGYYAVASRDPHLAAIGFVWNPLPSLLAIPLLLLTPFIREFGSLGLAGTLPTLIAGAATVGLIHATLGRLGVGRVVAVALAVVYGLHPFVIIANGAGLSEIILLLWLAVATWALIPWVDDHDPVRLVTAGVALGAAYLTRYEAVAPGLAVMIGVGIATAARHAGRPRRWAYVGNDVAIVGLPFLACFAGWAVASKLIVGQWFPTITSSYGNSAQVHFSQEHIVTATCGAECLAAQASGLMPVLLLLLPVAIVVGSRWRPVVAGVRRARLVVLVPIATFGAVLVFQWFVALVGGSFAWLRFQIAAIPLAVLLAGVLISALPAGGLAAPLRRIVGGCIVGALALSWPSTLWIVRHPTLAREELIMSSAGSSGKHRMEREIATWLDRQELPDGAVLTDVAYSSPIVLASDRPRQFTITPDRDFKAAVTDPRGHRIRYALVPTPEYAVADALERQYPGMHAGGAGVADLRQEWRAEDGYTWRVYEFR